MSAEKLKQIIEQMEPGEAVSSLAIILKNLFKLLDEDDRVQFIVNLVGSAGDDKVAGMVHL
ncbi:MAG: hypothetical protein JW882_06710 [Deltaproteobacteria bacterium]|nr:hypothetical protein [Deltaproteobacteria bacterium]